MRLGGNRWDGQGCALSKRGCVLLAMLIGLCGAASAQSLAITRATPFDAYMPGKPLLITLYFDTQGGPSATAIAVREFLPAGWSIAAVESTGALPELVDTGTFALLTFFSVPPTPFAVTYRVDVPESATGPQQFAGDAIYRLDDVELATTIPDYAVQQGQFTLTTGATGPGTVLPGLGAMYLPEPAQVLLEALPTSDSHLFGHWEGDATGTGTRTYVNVDQDRTVQAVFVPAYRLSLAILGEGLITPDVGEYRYPDGAVVPLLAVPASGWGFAGWQGTFTDANTLTEIGIAANTFLIAVFKPLLQVAVTTAGQGKTRPPAGVQTYTTDATVSILATPESGWIFAGWQGDVESTENPLTFTATQSVNIEAIFARAEGEGEGEAEGEGDVESEGEGAAEGEGESEGEGETEGEGDAEGEGETEGEGDVDSELAELANALMRVFLDADGSQDGTLDSEESQEANPEVVQARFDALDLNQDGALIPNELALSINPGRPHSADQDDDGAVSLSELLRAIQFYNATGYHCDPAGEDGFAPQADATAQDCFPHTSDYAPHDWAILLSELLRTIQFYNTGSVTPCPELATEDSYCNG